MALSAAFTVEGNANPARHQVTYGSTVDLALTSEDGATSIVWQIMGCSDPDEPIPTISYSGSPYGKTASFVMPADSGDTLGRTFLVRCTVSNQTRGADGEYERSYAYGVVGAINSQGRLPIVPGEKNYRHGTHGWAPEINELLNASGGGGGGGSGGGWTDDGSVVRLTTAGDSVAIGTASLSGTEKLRVLGNSRFEQQASSSGNPKALYISGAGHTALTSGAEIIDVDFALDRTVQRNTGAVTTSRAFVVRAPTYSFVGSSTVTDAATFAISGAPAAGTNATLTNSYALWVQAGAVRFASLGAGVVQSSATGVLSSSTLSIASGGTGLTSAGGVANRVLLTTNGTTFSVGQIDISTMTTGSLPVGSLAPGAATTGQALIYNGSAWAAGNNFSAQNLVSTGYFGTLDTATASATASAATFRGGDASGTGGTGAALTVRAGDATGASGTRTGGALTIRAGNGSTQGGNVSISAGNGTTEGAVNLLSGAGSVLLSVGRTSLLTVATLGASAATTSVLQFLNTSPTALNCVLQIDTTSNATGRTLIISGQGAATTGGALILASGQGSAATPGDLTLKLGGYINGIVSGSSRTVANWSGSGSDFVAFGALPATTGALRLSNNTGIYWRDVSNAADRQLVSLTNGDTATFGNTANPTVINGPAGSNSIRLNVNSSTALNVGTSIIVGVTTLTWDASQTTPIISQTVDVSATTTGDAFTIAAQDCSGTTSVTAGSMTLRAGDATGASGTRNGGALTLRSGTGATAPGDVLIQYGGTTGGLGVNSLATTIDHPNMIFLKQNGVTKFSADGSAFISYSRDFAWNSAVATPRLIHQVTTSSVGALLSIVAQESNAIGGTGGALSVQAGDATGASGTRTGGALTLRSGTGTSAAGDVSIQRGASVVFSANSSSTFVDNASTITFRIASSTTHTIGSAAINAFVRDYLWNDTVATPRLMHQTTAGTTGTLLSVIAQDTTAIGGTAGGLLLRAGDATGASGTRTGGALTIRSGTGATAAGTFQALSGTLNVIEYGVGDPTTLTVGDALLSEAWYRVATAGTHRWRYGSNQLAAMTSTVFELSTPPTFRWATGVASPSIMQVDDVNATATGDTLTIRAQDCSGATSVTAGGLVLRAGDATAVSGTRNGGALTIRSGNGVTSVGTVQILAGASTNVLDYGVTSAGNITLGSAGTASVLLSSGNPGAGSGSVRVSSGAFSIADNTGGDAFRLNQNNECHIYRQRITLGESTLFQIAIGDAWNDVNFQSGEGVIYIRNRTAAPIGNPATGGFLYVESGALKYRGSSGTVTTIANA